MLTFDPLGLYGAGALATMGGVCVAADGPAPVGDLIGIPLLIGAAGWALTDAIIDWWGNVQKCEDCKTFDICRRLLALCMANPYQPSWNKGEFGEKKDCGACFRECKHDDGGWPYYKCPLP